MCSFQNAMNLSLAVHCLETLLFCLADCVIHVMESKYRKNYTDFKMASRKINCYLVDISLDIFLTANFVSIEASIPLF